MSFVLIKRSLSSLGNHASGPDIKFIIFVRPCHFLHNNVTFFMFIVWISRFQNNRVAFVPSIDSL